MTPKEEHMSGTHTLYARRWQALIVLAMSLLIVSVDNTILNVGLPTIRDELDASSSQLQWIVDSYLLVFAGLLLAAGSLGDRFGRKRALVSGLVVFGLGLAMTTGALGLLERSTPDPGRAAELAALVAANAAATLLRFVLLRSWVFHPRRTPVTTNES